MIDTTDTTNAGTTPAANRGRSRGTAVLIGLYLVLAVVGLVGTWYFNLQFTASGSDQGYVQAWFANSASSSAAVDVIVTAVAACVFYAVEGFRLRMRWTLALIPLTFLVALAFTFPLFLALREWRLAKD